MSSTKSACEVCGSSDNLSTFDNGSQFCFTPDCAFNKKIVKSEVILTSEDKYFSPLVDRKISQKTCEFFKYYCGVDKDKQAQFSSYMNTDGTVAYKIRYPDNKKFMPWINNKGNINLFGKELWNNNANALIITEGELDAMSVAEAQGCKYPVVSLANGAQSAAKSISNEIDWLSGFQQIILLFDEDDSGRTAIKQCVDLFPPGKVRIGHLSLKDASDVLVAGRGLELVRLIYTAVDYKPDGVYCGIEVDLDKLFNEPDIKGYKLPYPILNYKLRGLHKGRILTLLAGTGIGKSTLMKELVYSLRTTNPELKIANIFLEEDQKFTLMSYLAIDNNIPAFRLLENKKLLTSEQITESSAKLIQNENCYFYDHFGSLASKRLMNILEYLAAGKKVDFIILDHISIVISGVESSKEGERRDIDMLMTNIRSLAARTGVGFIIASHLKRKDKAYSEGADINEDDARGSGSISQISDFTVAIIRDKRSIEPDELKLKIIKNRLSGKEGEADVLKYYQNTGRIDLLYKEENHKRLYDLPTEDIGYEI